MFELIQTGTQTYYIKCHSNVGVYLINDSDAYLIDSAYSGPTANRLLEVINDNRWNIKGIINTHSHIDHMGGNDFLQKSTGCDIFAPRQESVFMSYPAIAPAMLYGGYPPQKLLDTFLMPHCPTKNFDSPDFPDSLRTINLPGHFFEMTGIVTPDHTAFIADALCGEEVLRKTGITFIYDIPAYLSSLDLIENLDADTFIASHAPATGNIGHLATINRDRVYDIGEQIVKACTLRPQTVESLTRLLTAHYRTTVKNIETYTLLTFTIRSYLSWLTDTGRLTTSLDSGILSWQKDH